MSPFEHPLWPAVLEANERLLAAAEEDVPRLREAFGVARRAWLESVAEAAGTPGVCPCCKKALPKERTSCG